MNSPDQNPKLPAWIFFLTDVVLIGTAVLIGLRAAQPLSTVAIVSIVICVGLGAIIALAPIVARFERQKNQALDERQRALEGLSQTVAATAEQISIATGSLHDIADAAQKNLRHAEQLPHKLQEKIAEFRAQLDNANDAEKEELEKEIATLRSSESERLDSVATRITKTAAEFAKLEAATKEHLASANDALGKLALGTAGAIGKAQAAAEQALGQARTEAARSLGEVSGQGARAIETARTAALAEIDAKFAALSEALAGRAAKELAEKLAPQLAALESAATRATEAAIAAAKAAAAIPPPPPPPQPAPVEIAAAASSEPAAPAPLPEPPSPIVESPASTTAPTAIETAASTTTAPAETTPPSPAPPPKRPRKPKREEPPAEIAAPPVVTAEPSQPSAATEVTEAPADLATTAPIESASNGTAPSVPAPAPEPEPEFEPAPLSPEKFSKIEPVVPLTEDPFSPRIVSLAPAAETSGPVAEPAVVESAVIAPTPLPEPVEPPPAEPPRKRAKTPAPVPAPDPEPQLELGGDEPLVAQGGPGERVRSSDGATRLLATAYIGIGNRLFIRGEGPGLSWEKGVALQFVSIGKWRWETNDANGPVRFKLFKNDEVECTSLGTQAIDPGQQAEVTAAF